MTTGDFLGKQSHVELSSLAERRSSAFYQQAAGWASPNPADFSPVAATWEGALQVPSLAAITGHQPLNSAQVYF